MPTQENSVSNLILHCIETEDKKNPYTDEKIADLLGLSRETVTNIRKEKQIPDSRERRKVILNRAILNVLNEQPDLSDRALTKILNEQNFIIGKYAVSKLRLEISKNTYNDTIDMDLFEDMVGSQGSMKNVINRCLAALIYPPNGMNCLIVGKNGTGKSLLAKKIVQYAKGLERYHKNLSFCEINCLDYIDREKELLEHFFGVKGKSGFLEIYHNGIIIIKNLQAFPIQGKEMLFRFLNSNSFQRMDSGKEYKSSALIIAGIIEEYEDYQRHFSMVASLPSFEQRPMKERLKFIQNCFSNEGQSLKQDITVKKEAMLSLLSYRYVNNFTQIQNEIKVSCAKALLDQRIGKEAGITVRFENLSESLRNTYFVHNRELQKIIRGDMIFASTGEGAYLRSNLMDSLDIYSEIGIRFENLKKQGMNSQNAANILMNEIEMNLSKQIHDVEKTQMSREEISAIVGKNILDVSQEVYARAKKELPYLSDAIIVPLSIHLKMIFERKNSKKSSFANEMKRIKENSMKEYLVATNIMNYVGKKLGVVMPEEEAIFLTMYFQKFQNQYFDMKKKIAVLVVSHGHVASAMAEISNMVMGEYHAVGLDLEFSDTPKVMADKVVAKVHEINQGKGCIILVDMGSLLHVKEKVEKELGVKVGIVGRTDTMMVIECIRKTLWTNETIDEIVESLDVKGTRYIAYNRNDMYQKSKAILSCCITGEGAAIQLENYLKQRFESIFKDIVWLHLGYADEIDIQYRIQKLQEKYEIMACVGTLDPRLPDIPFYSSQDVYSSKGLNELKNHCGKCLGVHNALFEVLDIQCISIMSGALTKEQVIDDAVSRMEKAGRVSEHFLLSVYKREAWLPTYLHGDIAIPHGESEFVTKSVIHITKLDTPICWDGENFVDFVFTIALKEEDTETFSELYKQIKEPSFMELLRLCQSEEEILSKFVSIQY